MNILKELFGALDIVALQRTEPGRFEVIGNLPGWFVRLYPECVVEDRLDFGGRFLFLDNFLIDAEKFWNSDTSGRLKSGPWIEVDTFGKERQLEASALNVSDQKILLIEFAGAAFQERQEIIQKGREQKLSLRTQSKVRRNLQRTADRYMALTQVLPYTVVILNDAGTCVDVVGHERKRWIGKRLETILPEDTVMTLREKIAITMQDGSVQTFEFDMVEDSNTRHYNGLITSCGKDEVLFLILDHEP